jgi:26S proteasome regulatory subunit N10
MSPAAFDAKAIAILLDNTTTCIDGDFFPTRLDAQKLAVERLSQYLFSVNALSQVAMCALSSSRFGVRASFTSIQSRVMDSLRLVTASTGVLRLAAGIRLAVLALHHCSPDVATRRILAFVGAAHDVANADAAAELAALLLSENVLIDFVVIGCDAFPRDILRMLVPGRTAHMCTFLEVHASATILSDNVLASPIGPGQQMAKLHIPELARADPDLAQALSLSIAQPQTGPRTLSIEDLLQPAPQARPQRKTPRIRKVRKDDERRGREEEGKD